MEAYTDILSPDPETWPDALITNIDELWFQRVTKLGEGENCAVYSIAPAGVELVESDYGTASESDEADSRDSYFDGSDDENGGEESESEEESDGETKEESDGETKEESDGENMPDVMMADTSNNRVYREGPMGPTQLVAKRFKHLDEQPCHAVWDLQEDIPCRVFDHADDCADWMRARQWDSNPRYVTRELTTCITADISRFVEFDTESLCHLLLSQLVVKGVTPHIAIAFEAVRHRDEGYLLMERLQCTLDDILNDDSYSEDCLGPDTQLTTDHIALLFFQTLFAVHVVQQTCQTKHHDLHTGNAFLKRIDADTTFRGEALLDATHFHYRLGTQDFYLPNCGILMKLADFGMASLNVHGRRLQRVDMDVFNDDPNKWGMWNGRYDGERGYDTQVFFGEVPFDRGSHHKGCTRLRGLMRQLRTATMGKKGRVTKAKSRPLSGHVSNKTADAILEATYVRNVKPWYDYRTAPDASTSKIVTLGTSDWFV